MSEKREEYKFDHFKNIDEVMYYFNYWYKEEDVYSINRYLSLKDFNYISNKYQGLQKENEELKKQLHDASIQIQEMIEQDIECPSNCEKLEKLQQENKHLDKVNCKLRKTNEQLQEELKFTIGIVEHNRIISEKNKETHQLKDNWNKLKEYIRENIIYDDFGMKILDPSPLEDYIQELEQGSDSNE